MAQDSPYRRRPPYRCAPPPTRAAQGMNRFSSFATSVPFTLPSTRSARSFEPDHAWSRCKQRQTRGRRQRCHYQHCSASTWLPQTWPWCLPMPPVIAVAVALVALSAGVRATTRQQRRKGGTRTRAFRCLPRRRATFWQNQTAMDGRRKEGRANDNMASRRAMPCITERRLQRIAGPSYRLSAPLTCLAPFCLAPTLLAHLLLRPGDRAALALWTHPAELAGPPPPAPWPDPYDHQHDSVSTSCPHAHARPRLKAATHCGDIGMQPPFDVVEGRWTCGARTCSHLISPSGCGGQATPPLTCLREHLLHSQCQNGWWCERTTMPHLGRWHDLSSIISPLRPVGCPAFPAILLCGFHLHFCRAYSTRGFAARVALAHATTSPSGHCCLGGWRLFEGRKTAEGRTRFARAARRGGCLSFGVVDGQACVFILRCGLYSVSSFIIQTTYSPANISRVRSLTVSLSQDNTITYASGVASPGSLPMRFTYRRQPKDMHGAILVTLTICRIVGPAFFH